MPTRSLLILGGSGYIGKSILAEFSTGKLNKYKFSKIILISRNIIKIKKKFKNNKNITFISGDLTKLKKLPNVDVIIHAAESSIKHKDYKSFKKNQLISNKVTENIIKILYKTTVPKKVIYLSSGAVYGNNQKIIKIKEKNLDKKKIYKLNKYKKTYALNKLSSERKFIKLNTKHNIIILRLFSFAGNYISNRSNNIIFEILKWIKYKNILKIHSSNFKYTFRSFLKSDELVKSIMECTNFEYNIKDQIFNIGSNRAINLFELVKSISKKYELKYVFTKKQLKKTEYYVPSIDRFMKYSKIKYKNNDIYKVINSLSFRRL